MSTSPHPSRLSLSKPHKLLRMEHEIVAGDSTVLRETKEVSSHLSDDGDEKVVVMHTRSIDGRSVTVCKVKDMNHHVIEKNIDSTFTQKDLGKFCEQWNTLWRPHIDDMEAVEQALPILHTERKHFLE